MSDTSQQFENVFLLHVAASFDKQVYLAESLGEDHTWELDMNARTITFDDKLSFKVQVLGTESYELKTWLWAWANESPIPDDMRHASRQLKAFGERHGVREFKHAEVTVSEELTGYHFAVAATGIVEAQSFYRCDYSGGALYALIKDPTYRWHISDPLQRILRIFPQVVRRIQFTDHKTALANYLTFYGYKAVRGDGFVLAEDDSGPVLRAEFDENRRLTNLDIQ